MNKQLNPLIKSKRKPQKENSKNTSIHMYNLPFLLIYNHFNLVINIASRALS